MPGPPAIALTGGGTLVLNRTGNTFTGNITVDGAGTTLAFVGAGAAGDQTSLGAAGARTVTLTNGATISVITATANPAATTKSFVFGAGGAGVNVATGLTFQLDDAGQFSGAGNITKTGDGLFFLNNQAFTYTGTAVNVNAGTLRVGANAGVLGTGTVAINVASGATYDNLIGLTGTKNITVGGTGVGGAGALIASSGTAGNIGGTVTLTADTAIGGAGTLTIGGVISDGPALSTSARSAPAPRSSPPPIPGTGTRRSAQARSAARPAPTCRPPAT
jgi:autotransporter-associated beta strand protein